MGVLRCLLALSVLLVHDVDGWFKLIDGAAAVQCFFLISGFYMALVLNERYADLGSFYFNRALRLLPTYWAVRAADAGCGDAGRPADVHRHGAAGRSDLGRTSPGAGLERVSGRLGRDAVRAADRVGPGVHGRFLERAALSVSLPPDPAGVVAARGDGVLRAGALPGAQPVAAAGRGAAGAGNAGHRLQGVRVARSLALPVLSGRAWRVLRRRPGLPLLSGDAGECRRPAASAASAWPY